MNGRGQAFGLPEGLRPSSMTGNALHNRQIQPVITQIKQITPIMPIPTHNAKHTSHTIHTKHASHNTLFGQTYWVNALRSLPRLLSLSTISLLTCQWQQLRLVWFLTLGDASSILADVKTHGFNNQ